MVGCWVFALSIIGLFIWIVDGNQAFFTFLIIIALISGFLSYVEGNKNAERLRIEAERLKALEISDVDDMDGLSFERYVAKLLSNEGCTQLEVTKGSGDLGIDIFATRGSYRYAIQVKRYAKTVPRSAISDAVAGRSHFSCDRAMVITNSYLSKKSREFALSVGCEVVDRNELCEWIMRFQAGQAGKADNIALPKQTSISIEPLTLDGVAAETDMNPEQRNPVSFHHVTLNAELLVERVPIKKEEMTFEDVIEAIKKRAAKEYPKDYRMQAYIAEKDLKAYYDLAQIDTLGMSEEDFLGVLTNAKKQWANDYSMQFYVVNNNIKAFSELKSLQSLDIPEDPILAIKREAARRYPCDFTLQLYVVKQEIDSFRVLNRLGKRDF